MVFPIFSEKHFCNIIFPEKNFCNMIDNSVDNVLLVKDVAGQQFKILFVMIIPLNAMFG